MIHYKENDDYVFLEVNGSTGIKILTEDYNNVIFTYYDVSISDVEENSDIPPILSFNYNVIDSCGYIDELFDEEFKNKIGDILLSILLNSLENTGDNQ